MQHHRLSVRLLVIASFLILAHQTYAKSLMENLRRREVWCPDGWFKCAAGTTRHCAQPWQLCDGDDDCLNMSDEDPDTCQTFDCGENNFKCDNGQCIYKDLFCSLDVRCHDGSLNPREICESVSCPTGMQMCSNGERCLYESMRCDGNDDCGDMSDENPDECPVLECQSGFFKCPARLRCVPASYLCDGGDDCGDMSDEDQATCDLFAFKCNDDQFKCATYDRCIPRSWLCDGVDECGDMSDEPENCAQ